MELLIQFAILIAGFVLLIVGADKFVAGASGIATKFGIPQIVIGLTIVAMGTSAPEAAVSITGALAGNSDIAIGNVVGSNILNILLILGITGTMIPLAISKEVSKRDIPIVTFATIILLLFGLNNRISFIEGIIFLVLFVVYLVVLFKDAKKNKVEETETIKKLKPIPILLIMIVGGLFAIVFGSKITVSSASAIATAFGMSERLIGLTIVAFGTSLPELVTSVIAAKKGNADIAIGNVVGSSIFNILFILGITAIICPIPFNPKFIIDTVIAIITCLLLGICAIKDNKLVRIEAIFFLICYAGYFVYLLIG